MNDKQIKMDILVHYQGLSGTWISQWLSSSQALTMGFTMTTVFNAEFIMFGSCVSQIALVAKIWLSILRPHTKSQRVINCWDVGARVMEGVYSLA